MKKKAKSQYKEVELLLAEVSLICCSDKRVMEDNRRLDMIVDAALDVAHKNGRSDLMQAILFNQVHTARLISGMIGHYQRTYP